MGKLKKIFANTLIVVYAIVAIAVTILLLSYNDYHCSVIGGYTFILVQDDELEEHGFEEGSLVLVKETKAKNIKPGDGIFLYRNITTTQFEIKYAEVLMKDTSRGDYDVQFILEGNAIVDYEDVIGSTEDMIVVPHLGTILSILQSRYGYLFLIVVVSFIAFLYEIYELIMEIKYGEREEDEEDYDDDEDYEDYDDYEDDEDEEEKPRKTVGKQKRTAKPTQTTRTAKSTKTTKKTTTTTKKSTTSATKRETTATGEKKSTASGTKKRTTTVATKKITPSAAKKTATASGEKKSTPSTAKKTTTTRKKTTQAK